jgi:hypothetical protein
MSCYRSCLCCPAIYTVFVALLPVALLPALPCLYRQRPSHICRFATCLVFVALGLSCLCRPAAFLVFVSIPIFVALLRGLSLSPCYLSCICGLSICPPFVTLPACPIFVALLPIPSMSHLFVALLPVLSLSASRPNLSCCLFAVCLFVSLLPAAPTSACLPLHGVRTTVLILALVLSCFLQFFPFFPSHLSFPLSHLSSNGTSLRVSLGSIISALFCLLPVGPLF